MNNVRSRLPTDLAPIDWEWNQAEMQGDPWAQPEHGHDSPIPPSDPDYPDHDLTDEDQDQDADPEAMYVDLALQAGVVPATVPATITVRNHVGDTAECLDPEAARVAALTLWDEAQGQPGRPHVAFMVAGTVVQLVSRREDLVLT